MEFKVDLDIVDIISDVIAIRGRVCNDMKFEIELTNEQVKKLALRGVRDDLEALQAKVTTLQDKVVEFACWVYNNREHHQHLFDTQPKELTAGYLMNEASLAAYNEVVKALKEIELIGANEYEHS